MPSQTQTRDQSMISFTFEQAFWTVVAYGLYSACRYATVNPRVGYCTTCSKSKEWYLGCVKCIKNPGTYFELVTDVPIATLYFLLYHALNYAPESFAVNYVLPVANSLNNYTPLLLAGKVFVDLFIDCLQAECLFLKRKGRATKALDTRVGRYIELKDLEKKGEVWIWFPLSILTQSECAFLYALSFAVVVVSRLDDCSWSRLLVVTPVAFFTGRFAIRWLLQKYDSPSALARSVVASALAWHRALELGKVNEALKRVNARLKESANAPSRSELLDLKVQVKRIELNVLLQRRTLLNESTVDVRPLDQDAARQKEESKSDPVRIFTESQVKKHKKSELVAIDRLVNETLSELHTLKKELREATRGGKDEHVRPDETSAQ